MLFDILSSSKQQEYYISKLISPSFRFYDSRPKTSAPMARKVYDI
jgi:hypothetical protein